MSKELYHLQEFLKKTALSEAELAEWEKNELIKSDGRIDSKIPFYTEEHARRAQQIRHLADIGYTLPEIRKILKKIGLPKKEQAEREDASVEYLTVGELADQVRINNRTIKYWEERGIIAPDRRTSGGFRLYAKYWVQLCLLIQDLQNFGYSLEYIKTVADLFRNFIALEADKERHIPAAEALAQIQSMEEHIKELSNRMNELRQGIERWEGLLKKKRKEIAQFGSYYQHQQVATGRKE